MLIFGFSAGSWHLEATFLGSTFGSRLGQSLAMDGSVLVAGAPGFGPHGAVYVYGRTTSWFELQRLDCPADVGSGAGFGSSVALAGDSLVVGAPYLNRLAAGGANVLAVGGVYTYDLPFVGFVLETHIRPAGALANDNFGRSVALWRLPGHGLALAAGAPNEDNGINDPGGAHLFLHEGTRWVEQYRLINGGALSNERLGSGVAVGPMGVLAGAPFNEDLEISAQGTLVAWNGIVPLFYDGFESGDTSGWDVVVP